MNKKLAILVGGLIAVAATGILAVVLTRPSSESSSPAPGPTVRSAEELALLMDDEDVLHCAGSLSGAADDCSTLDSTMHIEVFRNRAAKEQNLAELKKFVTGLCNGTDSLGDYVGVEGPNWFIEIEGITPPQGIPEDSAKLARAEYVAKRVGARVLHWTCPGHTPASIPSSTTTPTPSRTTMPTPDQTYQSVDQLRDAFVAAGGKCSPHAPESEDSTEGMISCSVDTVLTVFRTQAQKDENVSYLRRPGNAEALLVGPNWLVNSTLATIEEVRPELGGTVIVPGE